MLRKLSIGVFAAALLLVPPDANAQVSRADEVSLFTETEAFEVAGVTLQPGTYLIRVVDQTSGETYNRNVIQITSEDRRKVYVTAAAVPHPVGAGGDTTVPVFEYYPASSGRVKALRSWYPARSATVRDIVYPKSRATALAEVTREKIPAIADDTKPTELLSADFVPVAPEPVVPKPESTIAESQPPASQPASTEPMDLETLPQTASKRPLLLLLGTLSLACALVSRSLSRLRVERAG